MPGSSVTRDRGSTSDQAPSSWGVRAANLYDEAYAHRYRDHDDRIQQSALVEEFARWLGELCGSFGRNIAVLDLGCGTGRYFSSLTNVRELVGIDASGPMLDQARRPVHARAITVEAITLVEADFLTYPFEPDGFDLVYSIGVLAEHTPFDHRVTSLVYRWLKPGGLFAFTAVHPRSFSVPQTLGRRLGAWSLPRTRGPMRRWLTRRFLAGGLYADEARIREVLGSCGFQLESLRTFRSDVHLHCLAVGRKA